MCHYPRHNFSAWENSAYSRSECGRFRRNVPAWEKKGCARSRLGRACEKGRAVYLRERRRPSRPGRAALSQDAQIRAIFDARKAEILPSKDDAPRARRNFAAWEDPLPASTIDSPKAGRCGKDAAQRPCLGELSEFERRIRMILAQRVFSQAFLSRMCIRN